MIITWHGFSCFKIQDARQSGDVSLVTDPFENEGDLKLPRNLSADILTVSHDHARHNAVDAVSAAGEQPVFVITGPGEYEVKDMFVTGVPTFHDMVEGKEKGQNTMYRVNVGELHLVHLGDLKHDLKPEDLEEFHNVDILMVPIGGGDVLDAKQAASVVQQMEPRVVIPMHYAEDDSTLDAFVKAVGLPRPEAVAKLKIAKKDLPQEEMKLMILERQ